MSDKKKKLFLLDAFALIYRAYFAFGKNQRYNSKGLNTSAMLGFTNTLIEVLEKQKPTHIAVVFDAPGGATNREEVFTDYKAGREAMPEDLRTSIPYIKQIIEAFNIPMYLLEGYEADDIIGTMAKEAERQGFETYMMTPDKDFGQLVSENIFMYKPAAYGKPAQKMGIPEVCEKFGVENPLQVIDILGLWGDTVDNIPGIPGIGEKTSKILIAKYGSVEGLIAHAHELKGKQKENVINFAEQGLLSKMLATIILDVPVAYDLVDTILEAPNEDKITEIFAELEFRNLAKRILGREVQIKPAAIPLQPGGQMDLFGNVMETVVEQKQEIAVEEAPLEAKDITNSKHSYHFVQTAKERAKLIADISKEKSILEAVRVAESKFGSINTLVNNAGINVFHEPLQTTNEEWDRCFDVNLRGAWLCCKALLGSMILAGDGVILNIASVHSFSIIPQTFPYPVAKHALIGMTKSLAVEYANKGIRVNALAPGYVETQKVKDYWNSFLDPIDAQSKTLALQLGGRIATAQEISLAAVFLVSDECPFINATCLTADGGLSSQFHPL